MLIFRCTTVQESREFAVLGKVSPSFCTRPRVSLGGGLRRRYDPVQNGSEADVGREMPRRVATVAVYGPWGRVSGRQSQAAGLLPLSQRAAAKSCFGQEWILSAVLSAAKHRRLLPAYFPVHATIPGPISVTNALRCAGPFSKTSGRRQMLQALVH